MSVGEAEAKITAVLKSLNDTPRTDYEVENLYRLNCERIAAARAILQDMSGAYVDTLIEKCQEAGRQAAAQHLAGVAGTAAVDDAFAVDFSLEEAEEANTAEVEEAKAAAAAGTKRSHKKGGGKDKASKSGKGKKEKRTLVDTPPASPTPEDTAAASKDAAGAEMDGNAAAPRGIATVLARENDLVGTTIPSLLTSSRRGRCEPVPNTPLARLFFTEDMDWDGTPCHAAVELYRCVVLALAYGEPLLSWADCQKKVQAQAAAGLSTRKGSVSGKDTAGATAVNDGATVHTSAKATVNAVTEEEEEEDIGEEEHDGHGDLTLSEQLVAEYEQAQQAEEEQDLDTSILPRDVPEKVQRRLRSFTNDVWVVLLCHGGYFAGGVFAGGTCVLHKAFQRYIVRKKQGGKQSSNAKDVGSYNSVGSQIRAAQEVKWRIDVRDILLEWTPYIEAASFILYAAPGPQNRAVLTDFSLLPAVAALGGSKGVSPIQLKDRRVSRVPLTTHRPNFEEVQRVYNACSHCSLLYVLEEPADG